MIEDNNGGTVDVRELNQWADNYGLTMPVVSDPNSGTLWGYADGSSSIGLPYTILIDRGVVIEDNDYPSQDTVSRFLR